MDGWLAVPVAWLVAFLINVVPAFMPPTWSILAVVHVTAGAPLLPLTIGGAAASAAGRVVLALGSRRLGRRLPKKDQENARSLGDFIERHHRWGPAIVFLGCLGPLPSNALFIAAGLGRIRLLPVVVAFFLSRCIADTFWVWSAGVVSENASGVFRQALTSWQGIMLQVAGLVFVVAVLRLPWTRWLGMGTRSGATRSASQPKHDRPAA